MMGRMESMLPPLVLALLEPQRYSGRVQRVDLVETHISWVLLAGEFAYKIKKPVKLPFLDFSTLARRQACCADEVRLNRRFSPDIYLGVVAIIDSPLGPQWGGEGAPIEYAVKMRRFDEAGRLDHVCQRGELRATHLSDLARTLVAFHEAAAPAPAASRAGEPTQVMAPVMDNFTELLRLPDASLSIRLTALRAWTELQFSQLGPMMASRKRAGRVRECHGDLHLANLVLIGQKVRLFDCIEFNEDLRWTDVASELAFTYIDLLAHGQPGLAGCFLDEVLSRSGDYEAALVLRFFAVYRALVRAKVAAIRASQACQGRSEVETYVALAERLVSVPRRRLVITHGLSGCGKTLASSQLLLRDTHAATLRLRSDVERKRLFGLGITDRSGSPLDAGLYAPDVHGRTYARLHELAVMVLRAGWSVIVDAAFLKRAERDSFREVAKATGADFAILAPQATPDQLRERIRARAVKGQDASEATLEVLARQRLSIEPLAVDEMQDRLP